MFIYSWTYSYFACRAYYTFIGSNGRSQSNTCQVNMEDNISIESAVTGSIGGTCNYCEQIDNLLIWKNIYELERELTKEQKTVSSIPKGVVVTLAIPIMDRSKTDSRRLPGVVIGNTFV